MDQIENENSNIETEAQADELLESIGSQESGGPIQEAKTHTPPPAPEEWDLTVGGKQIKAKRDQVLQWAQMGYSAPDKIRKFTQELEAYKQKEAQFKEWQEKYGPIDEYVRQKPEFWDHVTKSWDQRNQSLQDQSNPLAQVVSQLQTQIQDLSQFKSQVESERTQARVKQEDTEYLSTFEKVKTSYPDIDFVTPNAEGKTLEYEVLEFAQERGIKDFDIAFKAYKHDELMKRAESKAKESFLKEKQKNTKLGVLGITPAPTKSRPATSVRSKSYDDLADEIREEFGL